MTMKSAPKSAACDKQRVGDVDVAAGDALDVDLQAVAGEMLAHVGAVDLVLLAAFVGDDDDFDAARPCSNSGMASAMARAAGRLPSQHTMTWSSLSGAFWI